MGLLFRQAMSQAMHTTPGMEYPDDVTKIINGAYVPVDADELPSYESVCAAIRQDPTLKASTKARLQLALIEIRYQFWAEQQVEAAT